MAKEFFQLREDNLSDVYEWVKTSGYLVDFDQDGIEIMTETSDLTAYIGDFIIKERGRITVMSEDDFRNA